MGLRAALVAGLAVAIGACGPDEAANHGGGIGSGADGGGSGPDGAGPSGPPVPTIPIFDDTHVHEISMVMAPADWQGILNDPLNEEWRHATLIYDGVMVGDVGVRASGESSRLVGNAKMSMKIRFDAFGGPKFGGIDTLNLKGFFGDRSMVRERLALSVYRAVMPTPRMAHARLVVNGDLRGLYGVREIWDAQSLKEHYSEPLGALYRLRGVKGMDPYMFMNDNPATYVPFPWEQHLAHPGVGDEVVPSFLQGLASAPGDLAHVTDVDQLINYVAAGAVVMNTDGLAGDTGVEDHYEYFDPSTGKFYVLPWDPDDTFGSNSQMPDRLIYARFSKSRLLTVIRDYGDYHKRYRDRLASLMSMVTVETLSAELDRIMDQIADITHEDPIKALDNHEWDNQRIHLKDFIAARYAAIWSQIGGGP